MHQVAKALEIIKQALPDVQLVYVFGSTGTKFENIDSDLDLAILTPNKLDPVFRFQLAEQIASSITRDVDLIDLYTASTVIRFQIVSTGKMIFCQDKDFCSYFEMLVYSMYVRFNDERQEILDNIRKRGQILNG